MIQFSKFINLLRSNEMLLGFIEGRYLKFLLEYLGINIETFISWDCFILLQLVSFTEIQEPPLFVPLHPYQGIEEKEVKCVEPDMSPPEKVQQAVDCLQSSPQDQDALIINSPQLLGFHCRRIVDYAKAYTSGETTSIMMQMSFFINFYEEDILKQAGESTLQYKRGEPISALDGVPIDEIDCMPYPSFVGYVGGPKWMHKVRECKHDACCVSRLQSCGAIIVGKTNMHELGAGLSGINPHYGYDRGAHWPARNPYKKSKIVGGSFSGSAAVVATGLLQFCAFHCLRSSLRSGWSERCDKESMT